MTIRAPIRLTPPSAARATKSLRPELSYRARKILYAVISEYIATGEPVGSRRLAKRYGLNLSPATIRNELADLEDAGCLSQPHTSAGRVPTEIGYRIFIDALAHMRDVSADDRAQVLTHMQRLRPGIDDVVREGGKLLATLTGAAAIVSRPRAEAEPLAQIRFMPVRDRALLVVIVTRSGTVQNRVVEIKEALEVSELDRLHNYLAELGRDRTLAELRAALAQAMAHERDAYDSLTRRAKEVVDEVAQQRPLEADLLIEGQGMLFDRPEFADPEKIRRFLRTFEEKERLLGLLDRTLAAGGVQVHVGSEAELEARDDVGVISSSYTANGISAGSVAIIGPTRMDYAKLMPLVGFTAQVVSDVLEGRGVDDE